MRCANHRCFFIAISTALLLSGCTLNPTGDPRTPGLIYLEQGWNEAQRREFYHLSQGSQLLPYDWFLALEQPDSEALFRDDGHLASLGYLPTAADPEHNPDGLPVGFSRDHNPTLPAVARRSRTALLDPQQAADYPDHDTWLGFTCAACHTAELRVGETRLRIDGGMALIDHESFMERLALALRATDDDETRFARFAIRVLGSDPEAGAEAVNRLRRQVKAQARYLDYLVERDRGEHPYGIGRLDAFGAILNQVSATALGVPDNRRPANAPVSFPFLWDTPRLDWVQWNGSAANPIARNTGEVIGVYAHTTLQGEPTTGQFASSAQVRGLARLEELLTTVTAPAWPTKFLGPVDSALAAEGQALYEANCQGCHGVRDSDGEFPRHSPNDNGVRFIRTVMVPLEKIGTDSLTALNFLTFQGDPGDLRPYLSEDYQESPRVPGNLLLTAAVRGVVGSALTRAEPPLTDAERQDLMGGHPAGKRPLNIKAYKARPLSGVWATPPFLHTGAVPNLYQLLLPEEQRVEAFRLGGVDFDPRVVGFPASSEGEGYLFRVRDGAGAIIPGNSNRGHSGPHFTQTQDDDGEWRDFSEAERWALVEYLKTLR